MNRGASVVLIAWVVMGAPLAVEAQGLLPVAKAAESEAALPETTTSPDGRWEATLEGRIGFPTGHLQVVDRPTPATSFRLGDLGIHVSETLEASGAFYLTPLMPCAPTSSTTSFAGVARKIVRSPTTARCSQPARSTPTPTSTA